MAETAIRILPIEYNIERLKIVLKIIVTQNNSKVHKHTKTPPLPPSLPLSPSLPPSLPLFLLPLYFLPIFPQTTIRNDSTDQWQ